MSARETAVDVLSKALGIAPSMIDESTRAGVTPQWDSLAHLRIILDLEDRQKRKLDPEEIVTIASLDDVINILS